jgi:hypothetical protein
VAISAPQPRVGSPPPASLGAPKGASLPAPHAPKPAFDLNLQAHADATLLQRIAPGLLVLGSAVLLTILDQVYTAISGEVFTIASLRTSLLAGLMMLVGIALCLYRLRRD